MACCAMPHHLSRRQRNTNVIFAMPSSCSSEAEGVSSVSLMPQIQRIMARSFAVCVPLVPHFRYLGSKPSKHRLRTPCHLSWVRGVWWLEQAQFLELPFGHTASGSNDTVTAPTGARHITCVAESGFHIKHGAIDIHFLTVRPSMRRNSLVHLGQIYFGSLNSHLVMPPYILWTHTIHCEHRLDFLQTPLQQTAERY